MQKLVLLVVAFIASYFILLPCLQAQSGGRTEIGARQAGMANAVLTIGDGWSLFNNIGALAQLRTPVVMSAYDNSFTMSGLNGLAAGAAVPIRNDGTAGVGVWRFGDEIYNEHRVMLGYSHRIEGVSIGVQANYVQLMVRGVGVRRMLALEFGGVARLAEKLYLGAHIYNFNQAQVHEFEDERLPTIIKTGLSYRPLERVMFNIEVEKDIEYEPMVKAGIDYEVLEDVMRVRGGITTQPFVNYFGAGLRYKSLEIDYALTTQPDIGLSHHISLLWNLQKDTSKK
ncbi:MAG: hypothetical protein JJT94_02080 [Bernardetiaceae bacterium]|nr:hypothetical protein [Bernardetiaceae bacterium]